MKKEDVKAGREEMSKEEECCVGCSWSVFVCTCTKVTRHAVSFREECRSFLSFFGEGTSSSHVNTFPCDTNKHRNTFEKIHTGYQF